MAITAWLIDATPYRLRYKCHQDGVISSPPVAADGLVTIPNQGGATPDLRTDALNGAHTGAGGIPINDIMRVRLWGYGPIAAGAITQAQARALCNSDDPGSAVLTNFNVGRCVTSITPMLPAFSWAADWNVDIDGDPVCEVRSATGTEGWAILDIHFRHTDDL